MILMLRRNYEDSRCVETIAFLNDFCGLVLKENEGSTRYVVIWSLKNVDYSTDRAAYC